MGKLAYSFIVFLTSLSVFAALSEADLQKVELKTAPIYNNLAQMKSCYRGEEDTPPHATCMFSHDFTVKYFREGNEEDAHQRESYRVVFIDGKLRRANSPEQILSENGKMNYVMDEKGNFYVFNEKKVKEIRHSSFFAGGKVAGAGDLYLENGVIKKIDANSGHYEMTEEIFQNVMDLLNKQGVQIQI